MKMVKKKDDKQPNDTGNTVPKLESPEKKTSMFGWITQIGGVRDFLLVVAGATYVLGYLVWSYHAWSNSLGMLPALEAQYFVAGAIPLLIVLVLWWIKRRVFELREKYSKWFESDVNESELQNEPKLRLARAIFILWLATGVVWVTVTTLSDRFLWLEPLSYILVYIFIALFVLLPNVSFGRYFDKLFSWYQKVILLLFIVTFGFIGIFSYIEFVYPNIPQEFGGVLPRYAYLDIVLDDTSTEMLQEIVPIDATDTHSQVVRSRLVDVYFAGSDTLLVKAHGQKGRDTPTYEIPREGVKAVIWSSPKDEDIPSQ